MSVALERLRAADRGLAQLGPLASLCPDRERAHTLEELGATLLARLEPEPDALAEVAAVFAERLAAIAEAVARSFPGNLFWDLDFLAATLLGPAELSPRVRVQRMQRMSEKIVELQDMFSHASRIQFRYAHDFLYGFDWAKWVRRDPARRATLQPFDSEFLDAMIARGGELLQLIAADDDKYPDLPEGQDRNPFGFARDPESEALLHRRLAQLSLIPFEAWRLDAEPDWQRPYAELRQEHAQALGLATEPPLSTRLELNAK